MTDTTEERTAQLTLGALREFIARCEGMPDDTAVEVQQCRLFRPDLHGYVISTEHRLAYPGQAVHVSQGWTNRERLP